MLFSSKNGLSSSFYLFAYLVISRRTDLLLPEAAPHSSFLALFFIDVDC